MILRLVREQLRSHGRYGAWTTALLAAGMALASFTLITLATLISSNSVTADLDPSWRENGAYLLSVEGGLPAGAVSPETIEMPVGQVEALLDDVAGLPGVTAERRIDSSIEGLDFFQAGALRTPIAWDDYLAEGAPPTTGQIVVNASVADQLGISVGQRLELLPPHVHGGDMTPGVSFVVSGLSRSQATDSLGAYLPIPDGIISWEDSLETQRRLDSDTLAMDSPNGQVAVTIVQIGWNGDIPSLQRYAQPGISFGAQHFTFDRTAYLYGTNSLPMPIAVSILTIIGLIGAAFGMGRAQGQLRTEWIATARVLGATRRTIIVTSLLETLVVGSTGFVLGLGGGYLAARGLHEFRRATAHATYVVPHLSIPAIVPVTVAALSLVIAAILAAIPAFWATRAEPVAALKAVAPATSAPSSRSVSRWWPAGIALAGALVALVGYHFDQYNYLTWGRYSAYDGGHPSRLVLQFGASVAGIAGFAVLVDALRALIARLAARIARIPRAWAVAAGDGLAAHARLHTFAAGSFAILVGIVVAGVSPAAPPVLDGFNWQAWTESPLGPLRAYLDERVWGSHWYGVLVPALIVAAIIAICVTLSSRRILAADSATRAALGLSRRAERIAAAVRQGAPMMLGIVVGACIGWLLPLLARLAEAAVSARLLVHGVTWNLQAAGYGFVAIGYAIAPALVIALASSIVVGLTEGRGTPADARRTAAGVRS